MGGRVVRMYQCGDFAGFRSNPAAAVCQIMYPFDELRWERRFRTEA